MLKCNDLKIRCLELKIKELSDSIWKEKSKVKKECLSTIKDRREQELSEYILKNVSKFTDSKVGDKFVNVKTKDDFELIEFRVRVVPWLDCWIKNSLTKKFQYMSIQKNQIIKKEDFDGRSEKYIKALEMSLI